MTLALCKALPSVLPKAIAWGESQYELIMLTGQKLNDLQLSVAKKRGVVHPERIRIAEVTSLPQPDDEELVEIAFDSGVFGASMVCMTFGYGVYVCRGYASFDLLSSLFRHVQAYEQAGSIADYLRQELEHMANLEYSYALAEIDAQRRMQS